VPDGKRVAVVTPVEAAEALKQEHDRDAAELFRRTAAQGAGREYRYSSIADANFQFNKRHASKGVTPY
jgi:hypothetical protein